MGRFYTILGRQDTSLGPGLAGATVLSKKIDTGSQVAGC